MLRFAQHDRVGGPCQIRLRDTGDRGTFPQPAKEPENGRSERQQRRAEQIQTLTREQQKEIVDEALSKQQADGGFSLSAFVGGWKRHDNTPLDTRSDGDATGVVAYVLQEAGVKRDRPELKRGLAWLAANQDKAEGRWLAYSLN